MEKLFRGSGGVRGRGTGHQGGQIEAGYERGTGGVGQRARGGSRWPRGIDRFLKHFNNYFSSKSL